MKFLVFTPVGPGVWTVPEHVLMSFNAPLPLVHDRGIVYRVFAKRSYVLPLPKYQDWAGWGRVRPRGERDPEDVSGWVLVSVLREEGPALSL